MAMRKFRIVKYEWRDGRTTYDIRTQFDGRDDWTSTTDDYGYQDLPDARMALEYKREILKKPAEVEYVVSEHEMEVI